MSRHGGDPGRSDINMSLDDVPVRDSKSERRSPYADDPLSGDIPGRNRRIFVSHIPFRYNWRDLKDEVRKLGFEVVYAELFLEENGKSKGCGVVELSSDIQAKRAVEQLDGYMWDGMRLSAHEDRSNTYVRGLKSRVRPSAEPGPMRGRSPPPRSRSGSRPYSSDDSLSTRHRQLNALSQLQQLNQLASLLTTGAAGGGKDRDRDRDSSSASDNVVFVANVDYSIPWQRLKEMFSAAGRVRHVHLRTDREGKSKGVATVEFGSRREAQKCIDMFNGHMVNGRSLRLHIYLENDQESERAMSAQSVPSLPPNLADLLSEGGSSGNGSSSAGNPLQLLTTLSSLATLQQLTQAGSSSGVLEALDTFGRGAASSPSSSSYRDSHSSASRGGDNYRRRRDDHSRYDDKSRGPPRDYHHGSSERSSSRDPDHSRSMAGDYHHHSSHSSTTRSGVSPGRGGCPRVFVRNLDWNMDWQDIRDVFKEAGDVVEVDVMRQPDGRSKGRATISFRTMDDCYRAIDQLNGLSLRGRPIHVKMDLFS